MNSTRSTFVAGGAAVDISPADPQFLYGYPDVLRMSTGTYDPIFASALYLSDGTTSAMFIASDTIIAPGYLVKSARQRIEQATGVAGANIMVTASHTHSAPITEKMISNADDPVVPDPDPAYMKLYEDAIVEAATQAFNDAQSAEAGLANVDGTGLGTNRHDPAGPAIPQTPVLSVRTKDGHKPIAVMIVCHMHPTVLHEDSFLVSGDFPGLARKYLQENVVGKDCPIVYHMGVAGNQSPRHVTKANTFEEADRLGQLLGRRVQASLESMDYRSDLDLACDKVFVELPPRKLPSAQEAKVQCDVAIERFETLKREGAPRTEVRTAECDTFGAKETLTLAQCAVDGRLDQALQSCLPAEIQLIRVGPWRFIGWQGEVFVEFALRVMKEHDCIIITMANDSLHGYVVTQEAIDNHYYEAGNSVLQCPQSGDLLAEHTNVFLEKTAAKQG